MSLYFSNKKTFVNELEQRVKSRYLTDINSASTRQVYNVLGEMISEQVAENWMKTNNHLSKNSYKEVYYFSMEFLIGRLITNNIYNLGLRPFIEDALKSIDLDLNDIEHYEADAGLGNGGLGRLAACFLDSMASLGLPGFGNGIRYRYGLFEQQFKNGYQFEKPDDWLKDGYVWEVRKEEESIDVMFGGYVAYEQNKMVYYPDETIKAVPYDVPVVGNQNDVVTALRLWNAEPSDVYPPNVSPFEYDAAIRQISGFLYPDDATRDGKVLRLKQQYFFSSAGVRSIVKKHFEKYGDLKRLPEKVVIQINDTHPSLVVPELMRVLLDEYQMSWDVAWDITTNTLAYTNHTILAEALEKWPIDIFQPVLPRIYQIVEEINRRFCGDLMQKGYDQDFIHKSAILADGLVKMAHLAIVGSFSVNGVAALHTQILINVEMKHWASIYPDKFNNKTNGITHRRWLLHSNPELASFLEGIVPNWQFEPELLEDFAKLASDQKTQQTVFDIKLEKKKQLAKIIKEEQGIELDPMSMFDIQVKRLHEYKRQLMNALHIMYVYNKLKTDPDFKASYVPHSFIFGAKAASGYYFAKKIIKLITTIAEKVNNDSSTSHLLKVVFVENYNVTYAESIMPAADLSEQISTASKEASGTGNMKFMMNGAITIGTLDGANVEISELVGSDHIIIFGLNADEVNELYETKAYNPMDVYNTNHDLRTIIEQLTNGFFETVDRNEFKEIRDNLLYSDTYFVLKDFDAYVKAHEQANLKYQDQSNWRESMIMNIAKSAFFTSDRTIKQYSDDIWKLTPIKE